MLAGRGTAGLERAWVMASAPEEDGKWRAGRDFSLMILLHSFRVLGVNRCSKFRKNRTGKFKHSLKNWSGGGGAEDDLTHAPEPDEKLMTRVQKAREGPVSGQRTILQ